MGPQFNVVESNPEPVVVTDNTVCHSGIVSSRVASILQKTCIIVENLTPSRQLANQVARRVSIIKNSRHNSRDRMRSMGYDFARLCRFVGGEDSYEF
jgi:hypothetical protein